MVTPEAAGAPGLFYLSPHADDVVLSCAGHVRSDVEAGRKVTLVTVFLSGRDAETRRAEDERAAAILGCRYLCLDLFDAVDRPEVRGRLDVFAAFGPAHLGMTSEVVERLLWHVAPPAELRAPLAVGGHIDHRIVHEAARAVAYKLQLRLGYYEDQPYCLAPYALGRRLAALEGELPAGLPGTKRADPPRELRAFRDFYRRLPLLRSLPPGVRLLGSHLIARAVLRAERSGHRPGLPPRLQPHLREVSAYRAIRTAALAAYASQWPLFAASVEALEARLHDYGRALHPDPTPSAAGPSPHAAPSAYERLWQDLGVRP